MQHDPIYRNLQHALLTDRCIGHFLVLPFADRRIVGLHHATDNDTLTRVNVHAKWPVFDHGIWLPVGSFGGQTECRLMG